MWSLHRQPRTFKKEILFLDSHLPHKHCAHTRTKDRNCDWTKTKTCRHKRMKCKRQCHVGAPTLNANAQSFAWALQAMWHSILFKKELCASCWRTRHDSPQYTQTSCWQVTCDLTEAFWALCFREGKMKVMWRDQLKNATSSLTELCLYL